MFVPVIKTTGMIIASAMRPTEVFLTTAFGRCEFYALLTVGQFTLLLHSTGRIHKVPSGVSIFLGRFHRSRRINKFHALLIRRLAPLIIIR